MAESVTPNGCAHYFARIFFREFFGEFVFFVMPLFCPPENITAPPPPKGCWRTPVRRSLIPDAQRTVDAGRRRLPRRPGGVDPRPAPGAAHWGVAPSQTGTGARWRGQGGRQEVEPSIGATTAESIQRQTGAQPSQFILYSVWWWRPARPSGRPAPGGQCACGPRPAPSPPPRGSSRWLSHGPSAHASPRTTEPPSHNQYPPDWGAQGPPVQWCHLPEARFVVYSRATPFSRRMTVSPPSGS